METIEFIGRKLSDVLQYIAEYEQEKKVRTAAVLGSNMQRDNYGRRFWVAEATFHNIV